MSGRRQTTKGIWLALGQKIQEPRTLLLDLEGSDGRERGEDDNSFERQSSLFALAVAGGLYCPPRPSELWHSLSPPECSNTRHQTERLLCLQLHMGHV